jgi:alpha-N-acetylglucosaminidase
VYYEFIGSAPFRSAPVDDIPGHIVARSHRRYGLTTPNAAVTRAWTLLVNSSYSQDLSVQDDTGIPHLPGGDQGTFWERDLFTPLPVLCKTFEAWEALLSVGASNPQVAALTTYRYDLVNTGREVLARLSTPMSKNFTDAAFAKGTLDAGAIQATGDLYVALLEDADTLLATDPSFQLGPIIASARAWGAGNATDCTVSFDPGFSCPDFYEWNARVQITTWNPTPPGATEIPGGPIDYASKHWSGLIHYYYASRAAMAQRMALAAAGAGLPWDATAWALAKATHATEFQLSTTPLPTQPVGDYLKVSQDTLNKYRTYFDPYCAAY